MIVNSVHRSASSIQLHAYIPILSSLVYPVQKLMVWHYPVLQPKDGAASGLASMQSVTYTPIYVLSRINTCMGCLKFVTLISLFNSFVKKYIYVFQYNLPWTSGEQDEQWWCCELVNFAVWSFPVCSLANNPMLHKTVLLLYGTITLF